MIGENAGPRQRYRSTNDYLLAMRMACPVANVKQRWIR